MSDLTATGLAAQLTSTFLDVVVVGDPRAARAVEIIEPGSTVEVEPGDLVLGIGTTTPEDAQRVAHQCARAAGLVLRHDIAAEAAEVCRTRGLTLLSLSPQSSWSAVAQLVRGALSHSTRLEDAPTSHQDLFTLADTLSDLLEAPVTIEDPDSRVLAWSSNQPDADGARTATIIGRRVPRELRDRFRARGVFRHLATSHQPLVVPGHGETRPRWILPIRAGGEWLGSIWAAVTSPATPPRAAQARLLADVVALHLLRMRAHTELNDQLEMEQVRAALRGAPSADWLNHSTWCVVVLNGPASTTAEMPAALRQQVWSATLRRQGWSRPLLADLDGEVVALVEPGSRRPGTLHWLEEVVRTEHARDPALWATASDPVQAPTALPACLEQARDQARLGAEAAGPFSTSSDCWPALTLARALSDPASDLASPVRALAHTAEGRVLAGTLLEVLRHWGEVATAARVLGVHPNTVRNRLAKIAALTTLDLDDPTQRLAAWLDCERLT